MNDMYKKLIDLSIACGEKRLSPQTDYIHLKYHALQEEIQYPIPSVENFLFVLALFRTRSIENITRAKSILEKLLHFQGKNGNFPVYLHEYPECKDYYTAVRLLAPIYWVLEGYSHILGADLKLKLETVLLKLLEFSLKILDEKNPPSNIAGLIIAAVYATGKLLNLREVLEKGTFLLERFHTTIKDAFIPKYLSDYIVASQMVDPDLEKSFIANFADHLSNVWDRELCSYVGLSVEEYQSGFEPEVTLFDLAMGSFTGKFSKRALKDSPVHLQAALIQETATVLEPSSDSCRFSFVDQLEDLNPSVDKGFSPFKLRFGNSERLHTFVIEGGNSKKISMEKNGDAFEFLFTLSQIPELEDKQEAREVIFYFDLSDKTSFKIDGIKATTFEINDTVETEVDGFKFTLSFEVEMGSGQFMGHFMRGNRPSQIANKGLKRFEAYDNQIFLRTLRRSEDVVIKATLKLVV